MNIFIYYTTKLIQRANDYNQSINKITPLPVPSITLKFGNFRVVLWLTFVKGFFLFFKLSFPSVSLNTRREYSPSRIPIKIQHLKFAMFFDSVIVVFSRSVFSRVIILSLTAKKYIYSRYLWTTCLPINMTFIGTLTIAPN